MYVYVFRHLVSNISSHKLKRVQLGFVCVCVCVCVCVEELPRLKLKCIMCLWIAAQIYSLKHAMHLEILCKRCMETTLKPMSLLSHPYWKLMSSWFHFSSCPHSGVPPLGRSRYKGRNIPYDCDGNGTQREPPRHGAGSGFAFRGSVA